MSTEEVCNKVTKVCNKCKKGFTPFSSYHRICGSCHKSMLAQHVTMRKTQAANETSMCALTCQICKGEFAVTRKIALSRPPDHCPTCRAVYDTYEVVITFNVHTESHSGYCSEPYDIEVNDSVITEVHPLRKLITQNDIRSDNTINPSCAFLQLYESTKDCGDCCSRKSTKKVRTAEVRKKVIINLSDDTFH